MNPATELFLKSWMLNTRGGGVHDFTIRCSPALFMAFENELQPIMRYVPGEERVEEGETYPQPTLLFKCGRVIEDPSLPGFNFLFVLDEEPCS